MPHLVSPPAAISAASPNRLLRLALLPATVILLLCSLCFTAHAQWIDTTAAPRRSMYNVDPDEFVIGAYVYVRDRLGNTAAVWPFLDSLHMNLLLFSPEWRGDGGCDKECQDLRQLDTLFWGDTLANPAYRRAAGSMIANFHAGASNDIGGSREILFYPFDSAQTEYSKSVFTDIDVTKGDIGYNSYYDGDIENFNRLHRGAKYPQERVFSDINDTGLFAADIAFDYTGTGTRPEQNSHMLLQNMWQRPTFVPNDKLLYVVAIGHLTDSLNSSVNDSEPVFIVEVYQEVLDGVDYLDDNLDTVTASGFIDNILLDTFHITKGELLAGPPTLSENAYREAVRGLDVRYRLRDTDLPGPFHPNGPHKEPDSLYKACRLNIKVRWTGAEEAALRCVALRDYGGQIMAGTTTAAQQARDTLLADARRVLLGPSGTDASRLEGFLRLESYHEPEPKAVQYGGFDGLERFFRDSLVFAKPGGGFDTIRVGTVDHVPTAGHVDITNQDWLHVEYGYFDHIPQFSVQARVPHQRFAPMIAEHGGGTFTLPLLSLTPSEIEDFEETMQHGYAGFYTPERDEYGLGNLPVQELGLSARLARGTGKNLMGLPGAANMLKKTIFDTVIDGSGNLISYDSLWELSKTYEPAEMRMFAGLGLCYGAQQLWYWELGSDTHTFQTVHIYPSLDTLYSGDARISHIGRFFDDTTTNYVDNTISSNKTSR